MRRRAWFDWHSWVGLNLSLLMSFVLLTGTLATVSTELDWLGNPAKRASATDPGQVPPWGTMLANFERQFPDARALSIAVPVESWVAPELIAADPGGERFRVFFEPASGQIQGTGRWFNWQRFLREAHRHLMLPLDVGLTTVVLLTIPLAVTLCSSLFVYKRWWRGLFRLPRTPNSQGQGISHGNKVRRRFWGDVHRLAGVWCLWYILVMVVTAGWYLVEHFGLNATLPALDTPVGAIDDGTRLLESDPFALDEMIASASREYPALDIRIVQMDVYGGAVVLQGQADAVLVRDRANHVAFDGFSGAIIDVRHGESLDLVNRISEAADPLHFGSFAGPATRYLWAVFGLLMTILSVTGVYLYGIRTLTSIKASASGAGRVWIASIRNLPLKFLLPQVVALAVCTILAIVRAAW